MKNIEECRSRQSDGSQQRVFCNLGKKTNKTATARKQLSDKHGWTINGMTAVGRKYAKLTEHKIDQSDLQSLQEGVSKLFHLLVNSNFVDENPLAASSSFFSTLDSSKTQHHTTVLGRPAEIKAVIQEITIDEKMQLIYLEERISTSRK